MKKLKTDISKSLLPTDRHYSHLIALLGNLKTQKTTQKHALLFAKLVNTQIAKLHATHYSDSEQYHYPVHLVVYPVIESDNAAPGIFSKAILETHLEKFGKFCQSLCLKSTDNPFQNPALPDIIQLAHQYHIHVTLQCALSALNSATRNQIFETAVDELLFSADTPPEAEQITQLLAERLAHQSQIPKISFGDSDFSSCHNFGHYRLCEDGRLEPLIS